MFASSIRYGFAPATSARSSPHGAAAPNREPGDLDNHATSEAFAGSNRGPLCGGAHTAHVAIRALVAPRCEPFLTPVQSLPDGP
jgi:hypothetical protein